MLCHPLSGFFFAASDVAKFPNRETILFCLKKGLSTSKEEVEEPATIAAMRMDNIVQIY